MLKKIMSVFLSVTMFCTLSFFAMPILSGACFKEKSYTKHENIEYGKAERNLIDIYVPKSAYQRDYNGVILFIHGGSWTGGDKKDMNGYCETYAEKGYITATMSYTLFTEENGANAFTMLDEVDLAMQKIKEFSDERNLNITKIATCGYSAGGHISSLYAYTRAENCPIKLVFTANKVAPSDFHPSNWDNNYGEGMGYALACSLAGVEFNESLVESGEIEDIIASVSPASHINEKSVPTIAGYGGKDTTCSIGNALATKAALIDSGIDYDFILYPKSNHMLLRDSNKDALYKETFLEYCEKYFGYAPLTDDSQDTDPSNPDSETPDTDKVTNPEIPDTGNDLPVNTGNNSSGQISAYSNQNNLNGSNEGFQFKKEVILSAVLLVAVIGMGTAIVIIRKKEKIK